MIKFLLVGAVLLNNFIALFFILRTNQSQDKILYIVVSLVVSVFIQAFLSFHMWNAINDGKSPIHPVLAAGLHFVPLFNIIWTLILFGMYPKAFNDFVDRKEVADKDFSISYISSTPFTAYIILSCAMVIGLIIPFINILISAAIFFVYLGIIISSCGAIEGLSSQNSYTTSINPKDISIMPTQETVTFNQTNFDS